MANSKNISNYFIKISVGGLKMERNIKFDKSVYDTDIKELNSMLDELMKRKTMKKAYKKFLLNQEKDIKKISYNHINYDSGFDLQIIKEKKINKLKTSDYVDKNTGMIFG